ncbi:MAG TPA: EAL domain-containing protein [Methylomirabilota bacterium]|nr:EAL domain-containing protein [Methylomirabilota bacterium]
MPFTTAELRRALEGGELRQIYQVLVNLRTGKVASLESVIRWQHPDRGLLHAVPFVNDVAANGLAPEFMRWILLTAAQQLGRWRTMSIDIPRVSVNAWPIAVRRELIDDALQAAADAGLLPSDIEIETQPEASYNLATLKVLHEMREAGLRVALDDFGDGDLRFDWLRDAPFDIVKLPVTFVLRSTTPYDDAVIGAGVGFARAIGAETVAEGIETVALRDRVRALGIDIGQGYLWSPIVPADRIPDVIRAIGIDGARVP